jgi:hypothetical protein
MRRVALALFAASVLLACGDDPAPAPTPAPSGPEASGPSNKLVESMFLQGEVNGLAAEVLGKLYAGEIDSLRDDLGNEAFRKSAPREILERLATTVREKLDRPGKPRLDFYKTNVLTKGIVAEASYDVRWSKGEGRFFLRARKLDGRWWVEGFRVESAALR